MVSSELNIKAAVIQALDAMIREAREEVIKDAVKEFESRVRERVGLAALKIFDCYSVQRMGPEILIHVKVEEKILT